jgi:hypothetical protein
VTAKPVGIEALVVAARAAGYAMVPDCDTEAEAALDEQDVVEAANEGRALTLWSPNTGVNQGVAQIVSNWMRDRLPAIGWRAPA